MTQTQIQGNTIRLRRVFTDFDGAAYDPTDITLKTLRHPEGADRRNHSGGRGAPSLARHIRGGGRTASGTRHHHLRVQWHRSTGEPGRGEAIPTDAVDGVVDVFECMRGTASERPLVWPTSSRACCELQACQDCAHTGALSCTLRCNTEIPVPGSARPIHYWSRWPAQGAASTLL